ncbi:MAG: ABC transporter permease [Saccharofermentanales bacterium]|jgi:hypothetical protein
MAIWTLIRLKLRTLLGRPAIIVFCIVVPIILSLLAGLTIMRNDLSTVRGAYVDLADNAASHRLIEFLRDGSMPWEAYASDRDYERALSLGEIDGVLIIPEDFGVSGPGRSVREAYTCVFHDGRNRSASALVRENFTISSLALSAETKMVQSLRRLEPAKSLSVDEVCERLRRATEEAREDGASLKLEIRLEPPAHATTFISVPDLSIDIMFMSIFALLSGMLLADAETESRLKSIAGGKRRDFAASVIALAVACIVQLCILVGISKLLMPDSIRPASYPWVMAILLVHMLAYGQWVALIPAEKRMAPASVVMLLSLIMGGAFFHLPRIWIENVGQYTPHGWAMARLSDIPTTVGPVASLAIGFGFLLLAYAVQSKSVRLGR